MRRRHLLFAGLVLLGTLGLIASPAVARPTRAVSPPWATTTVRGHAAPNDYVELKRSSGAYRTERRGNGVVRFYYPGWKVDVQRDGTVRFHDVRARWNARKFALVFDITDAVMRRFKQDPYGEAKLAFLERSRGWRGKLRQRWRRRGERRYLRELPARLLALWKRADLPAASRRALIFSLWEECLEPGRGRRAQDAQYVRLIIRRFVQRHLPRGSAHGYTAAELRHYAKRRRGKVRFRPYHVAARAVPARPAPPTGDTPTPRPRPVGQPPPKTKR